MIFEPFISVIVPVYNGADYVGEAIESIFAQSYTNFEIIVVNDGSTDDGATDKAIEPYLNRVTYIKQENGGVSAALNTGIENMKGKYFGWLSHDDLFLPHKLESQVKILSDLIDRVVVLYSDYGIINFKKEHLYDVSLDAYMLNNSSNHMPVLRGCLNGCTMLIHRDIFEACGKFDLKLRFTQDYDMWDRICWQYPFIHQADITVRQRIHDGQDSHKPAALAECNNLWINMVKKRDDTAREEISNSSLDFLQGMQTFLSQTPYIDAQNYVASEIAEAGKVEQKPIPASKLEIEILGTPDLQKGNETIENLKSRITDLSGLTIIVNNETSFDDAINSLSALTLVESKDFEIIFLCSENQDCARIYEKAKSLSYDMRFMNYTDDLSSARTEAIALSQNKYVLFLTTKDFILPRNLSKQLSEMKQNGYEVSYAPYVSFCMEVSDNGVIVPSHWLGALDFEDIIGRCAVNLSTMIFEKHVFSNGVIPPLRHLISEIEFLLSVREKYRIHAFTDLTIISHTQLDQTPLNLTQSIDQVTELLTRLESKEPFSSMNLALSNLRQIHTNLYKIRLDNEKHGRDVSRNTLLESAYRELFDTNQIIGNTGLLNVDCLKDLSQ